MWLLFSLPSAAVNKLSCDAVKLALILSRLDDIGMNMTPESPPPTAPDDVASRRRWLAVLAHAPRPLLQSLAQELATVPFDVLRAPEVGLTMLRGRIGNSGDRFNVGEATLTRCVVRHHDDSANPAGRTVRIGVGYVLGRDPERAGWVARFDALLQQPRWQARLQAEVIAPLAAETARQRAAAQRETAASRVRFFNLQPDGARTGAQA